MGNTIDFSLKTDLVIDSLNAHGTVIDASGLSFKTKNSDGTWTNPIGPQISKTGINAGDSIITNVAKGVLDTDAVNLAQLHDIQDALALSLGGGASFQEGVFKGPIYNVAGGKHTNVGDALNALNTAITENNNAINAGWTVAVGGQTQAINPNNTVEFEGGTNISITQTNNDHGAVLTVALNKDIQLDKDGSLSIGGTTVNEEGLIITDGPSVTKDGINAGNKQVTNVADGQIAVDSQDAVNGGQIYNMMGAGAYDDKGKLTNIGGTGKDNINDAIAAVNKNIADNKVSVTSGSDNVIVSSNASGTEYIVDISKNLNVDSISAKDVNAGNVKADSIITGNTSINGNGLSIKDGPSITSSGVDAGSKVITNVNDGVQKNDAVNMGQLALYLGGNAGYNNIHQALMLQVTR